MDHQPAGGPRLADRLSDEARISVGRPLAREAPRDRAPGPLTEPSPTAGITEERQDGAGQPGDIVRVKVLEVDVARKRIALTRRLDDEPGKPAPRDERPARRDGGDRGRQPPRPQQQAAPFNSAMADALKGLKRG